MTAQVVFWIVVSLRFIVPLFIPRWPLPAIFASLVLDAADQTIFQSFGFNPPFYQSYDKAMDVFYLSIAYLASLRNWSNLHAVKVSRFLFFYRQVGALLFELTGFRWLLLVFPNTFEYFFIAYEGIRTRRNPIRYALRFWVLVAAGIWIFIKLPQEYWIHVAELDFTDTVRDVPWFGPAVVAGLILLFLVIWFVVRPRIRPPDYGWHFAADPLPAAISDAKERAAWRAEHGKVFGWGAVEKIFLIGIISVIYGQVLPGVDVSNFQLFLGIAFFVVINSALGLWAARRGLGWDSAAISFAVVFGVNVVIVLLEDLLLSRRGNSLDLSDTFFFIFLFSILTMLYDRYHPINEYRAAVAKNEVSP